MRVWMVGEAGGSLGVGETGTTGGISGVSGQETEDRFGPTEDQFAVGVPRNQLWAQEFYHKAGPGLPGRCKPIRH